MVVVGALSAAPSLASAELTVRDADGWRVYTLGRAESHYQLAQGDGDPHNLNNKLIGGQVGNTSQDENNQIFDSRIRSGFVATQLGLGVVGQFTPRLRGQAFVGIWLAGIDSHKGTPPEGKPVDAREGWGALVGPFGSFLFGRAFSIFASASGEVNAYAFEYAVGNPCQVDVATIACGSVGAGPLYAGYNAQLRYMSPRFAGLQIQASLEDPSSLPDYQITRYPRVEGELNAQIPIGSSGKFILVGQGMAQQLSKINGTQDGTVSTTAWGGMGVARLEVGGLRVGGGGWTGKGLGTHVPFQQEDQGKPLAHDLPGGMDAAGNPLPGDNLRNFRGFFGNLAFAFRNSALAVGGGSAAVQETVSDLLTPSTSLLRQNVEYHAVFTQRIYAVVLSAEYMHWRSSWYRGEVQDIDFVGAGSVIVW